MRKNIIYFGVILIFAATLGQSIQAQTNKEEVEYIQAIVGMEKKAAIAGFLAIEADNPFWAIYDEYETERKKLGLDRLDLLEKYANNYINMPDVVTDDIIKQMQKQKKSRDLIIDTYYKKVHKACSSKIAAQFYQFENYLLAGIRADIFESIPFIGELDD